MFKGLVVGISFVLSLLAYQILETAIDLLAIYILGTLWLAYLMFFINLLNSLTLKMLATLAEKNQGSSKLQEFKDIFIKDDGLLVRLEAMKKNGFISIEGESIRLVGRGASMSKMISIVRTIFSMK